MSDVLINCPLTGKALSTGWWAESLAFITVKPGAIIHCHHCEQNHPWEIKDAYLKPRATVAGTED